MISTASIATAKQIKQLRHSDNICTVGWSNLCGLMTPEQMRALLEICPRGKFVPCWIDGRNATTPEQLEALPNNKKMTRGMGRYYFDFPRDNDGTALISELFTAIN